MPHYHARAEFRRRTGDSPWVLAGVTLDGVFWPAVEGVEPVHSRLPEPGLVGWADLPTPILAGDAVSAASIALDVARAAWPGRVNPRVPYAAGAPDTA